VSVPAAPPMSTPNSNAMQPNNGGFTNNTALVGTANGRDYPPDWWRYVARCHPAARGIAGRIALAIRGSVAGTLTVPNALGMASIINRFDSTSTATLI
jgi:hypothetical protein